MMTLFINKKGSALTIAMISIVLLTAFVGATIQVSTSNFNYQKSEFSRIKGEALTAETVERYRRDLLNLYRREGVGPTFFVDKIREMLASNNPEEDYYFEDSPKEYNILEYPEEGRTIKIPTMVWIDSVSDKNSSMGQWVDIVGSVTLNRLNIRTRIRISFAPPSIYELALLTRTVNCMACHLDVTGDIGTIGDFRPGFGREGSRGIGSGNRSYVNGNLYASGGYISDTTTLKNALRSSESSSQEFHDYFLSADRTNNIAPSNNENYSIPTKVNLDEPFSINGMRFQGDIFVRDEEVGQKLPEREAPGTPRQFPVLDIPTIQEQAVGTVGAGGNNSKAYSGDTFPDLSEGTPNGTVVWSVPIGEGNDDRFQPDNSSQNLGKNGLENFEGYHNAHLILIGTKENPIRLDGDLVVEGDLVIKGYVEGRGTLYSGGNVYIAGDIIYADADEYEPFRRADLDNNGTVSEEERDEYARNLITDNRSELRLGARNNVVIGDWTYSGSTENSPETFYGYRSFLRSQFNTNEDQYFVRGEHGEEVRREGNRYFNDRNEEVPASRVQRIRNNNESYRAVFGTTHVRENGTLHDWMTQSQYRSLLFQQVEQNQFESYVVGRGSDGSSGKQGEALVEHLIKNGISEDMARQIANNTNSSYRDEKFVDEGDWAWRQDIVDGSRNHNVISIMIDNPTKPIRSDVGRIDGYLYASRRIAGHVYGKDLTINGGMIGEQIGVLAPGRRDFEWLPNRYGQAFRSEHDTSLDEQWFTRNDWYADGHSGRGGKLTINYDYRLRNGGQGFDLLADAGSIIFWDKSIARK